MSGCIRTIWPGKGNSLSAREGIDSLGRPDILLVDLREAGERARHGTLPGAMHAPYPGIADTLRPGGMLREVAAATGRRIVFFCAFGERSAMAVAAASQAGLANTAHIAGGMDAWKKAAGPVATGIAVMAPDLRSGRPRKRRRRGRPSPRLMIWPEKRRFCREIRPKVARWRYDAW